MINFLLVVHFIVTILMVCIILLQKSEGGGLGVGSGFTGGLITARGAANLLSRTTAVLASIFMLNCLLIGAIVVRQERNTSILKPYSALELEAPIAHYEAPSIPEEDKEEVKNSIKADEAISSINEEGEEQPDAPAEEGQ